MLLSYSIISAFIIGFGYLVYIFTTSGERQHTFNRGLLLTIYGIAIVLPFLILSMMLRHGVPLAGESGVEASPLIGTMPVEAATGVTDGGEVAAHTAGFLSLNLTRILYRVYIVGVVLTLIHTVAGWLWLLRTIRRGDKVELDGFTLILTDDPSVAPFSWRDTVVMRRTDYKEAGEMIMMHELAHLRLSHWADLIVAQCVICLQWFNPAAWALREELKAVHEYQADEAVIDSGADMKQYQMLLIRKAVGYRFQPLANSLNHSKLKKRVTMMYKTRGSSRRRLASALLLPAMAAGCAVTAIPSVAGVIESFASASTRSAPAVASVAEDQEAAPSSAPVDEDEGEIYQAVDEAAEFPEGQGSLKQYMADHIQYPEDAYKNEEQGRVIVKFVVKADGSIGDATVIKGVSPSLDKEALRLVKAMPRWKPGQVDGKPVASYFNLPVTFKIKEK